MTTHEYAAVGSSQKPKLHIEIRTAMSYLPISRNLPDLTAERCRHHSFRDVGRRNEIAKTLPIMCHIGFFMPMRRAISKEVPVANTLRIKSTVHIHLIP